MNEKHLEFLQNNITRMNQCSFQMKGWAITIVSAFIAAYVATISDTNLGNKLFIIVAVIPTVIFWFLDSLYLSKENKFIEMYNDVGRRDEDTIQGNANPALGAFEAAVENDSSATEVITLTPPTGLSSKVIFMIQILSVVLSGIAIMTVGIIAIKKKVLTK